MKTKKMFATAVLAALVCLQVASSANASIRTIGKGDTITIRYNIDYRSGSGGEFQLGKVNAPSNPNFFHTFCAETGENLGGNTQQYYVKSVGLVSNNQGGVLTSVGAKLYRDYYDAMSQNGRNFGYQGVTGGSYAGGSSNFFLGGGVQFKMANAAQRAANGAMVQKVLWHSLGYTQSLSGDALTLFNYYNNTYGTSSSFTGQYFGVRIANLVNPSNHAQRYQDQFVVVPEPGSLLVWGALGLATSGLAFGRRRKS